jgi:hypothetical protein
MHAPGLGKPLTPEEAEPVLLRALELGCTSLKCSTSKQLTLVPGTFWDTAVRHLSAPDMSMHYSQVLTGHLCRRHQREASWRFSRET